MPLINSDYSRGQLERIAISETDKANERQALGHTRAAAQHRRAAAEAARRIEVGEYGRRSPKLGQR